MRRRAVVWAVLAVPAALAALTSELAAAEPGDVVRKTLSNGMGLVMLEDHHRARVGIAVVYPVGHRDDPPGYQGLAHVLAWTLTGFRGHLAKAGSMRLANHGGPTYALPSADDTIVFREVDAQALETALWVESDRMAYLLATLEERGVAEARSYAQREWRERRSWRYAIDPRVVRALYPRGHPYRALAENRDETARIDLNTVRWFFQAHYGPSRALLVIVGDFEPNAAEAAAQKYFGPIRESARVERSVREYPLSVPRAATFPSLGDPDPKYRRLEIVWATPRYCAPGDAALDVAAILLEQRLEQSLVRAGLAFRVNVGQHSHALASRFLVQVELQTGRDPARALAVIEAERARLSRPNPGFEAARRVQVLRVLQRFDDPGTVALQLGEATLRGLPYRRRDVVARYRELRPSDVAQAATRYLSPDTALVVESEFTPSAGDANP